MGIWTSVFLFFLIVYVVLSLCFMTYESHQRKENKRIVRHLIERNKKGILRDVIKVIEEEKG